ncbi:hypothetical protein C7H84_33065 [Burkholderia sp. Nafp2/4-1b]|uniref:hypothetical protein n=1 Tax=Burkholderia sp. Nafp2/4-1b TaxID=2116686 RepID=UPI000EF8B591|nr:hypothetical protein [Burkholderia sp. Nafp2/4-1b]RKT99124.1 hypothetical protein C7H84_33065 [Burkholderia sp. Nafp2/4-1b]
MTVDTLCHLLARTSLRPTSRITLTRGIWRSGFGKPTGQTVKLAFANQNYTDEGVAKARVTKALRFRS